MRPDLFGSHAVVVRCLVRGAGTRPRRALAFGPEEVGVIGENASADEWIRSSFSSPDADQCVEVAPVDTGVLVRDSALRHGPVLAFSRHAWGGFVETVADGKARE